MLTEKQMQNIQDLKLRGLSIAEIAAYYESEGKKPPSLPTIRKYYYMDVLPEDPGRRLEKDKAFDHDPFRSTIVEIVRNLGSKEYCVSSVYDVLVERFVDTGEMEKLPENEQTLRNYIHYLQGHHVIESTPENRRIYDHVFDTPPGDQLLIDFGQTAESGGLVVHFICMLLRYSRYLCVAAQDHKFNAEEACRALYHCFCKLGGRPTTLVIDQDAVFVSSETYGEVIKTQTFEDFCTEQELKLWVCHKADPESKGPIENSVGFVKKNFFSGRRICGMDDVFKSLPGWLARKNQRIHQSTYRIPADVFHEFEKEALRPMLPSAYETSPSSYITCELNGTPYLTYRSCRYSVPFDYAYSKLSYKVIGTKLYLYDADRNYICTHTLSECRGSVIRLDEHKRPASRDWVPVMEHLRTKWDCCDFQHFINGFKKENLRYLAAQLTAVDKFLDAEKPDRRLVSDVMKICCEKYRYKFSQFKVIYHLARAGKTSPEAPAECSDVQKQNLDYYRQAFISRCGM